MTAARYERAYHNPTGKVYCQRLEECLIECGSIRTARDRRIGHFQSHPFGVNIYLADLAVCEKNETVFFNRNRIFSQSKQILE